MGDRLRPKKSDGSLGGSDGIIELRRSKEGNIDLVGDFALSLRSSEADVKLRPCIIDDPKDLTACDNREVGDAGGGT
jgi:hypothetical protein